MILIGANPPIARVVVMSGAQINARNQKVLNRAVHNHVVPSKEVLNLKAKLRTGAATTTTGVTWIWTPFANALRRVSRVAELNARMRARCWKGFVNAWKPPNVGATTKRKRENRIRVWQDTGLLKERLLPRLKPGNSQRKMPKRS